MLVSAAYAQEASGGGDMFVSLMPLVLIFVVFYFLMIRPQQKKAKAHKEMLTNLRRGDRIVTGGGIVGRVSRVEGEQELVVEIATDVKVRVMRATVSDLLNRSDPVVGDDGDDGGSRKRSRKSGKGRKKAGSDAGSGAGSDAGSDAETGDDADENKT